ncbi:MAG: hypothetical protein ACR2NU_13675, partial [Aeoliella sp.]
MKTIFLTLVFCFSVAPALLAQSTERGDPVLEECQLSFVKQNFIEISAEQAGVLRHLAVREGSQAADGAPIA